MSHQHFHWTLVLNRIVGTLYTLKPKNVWCSTFSTLIFCCSKLLNIVILNFIINKNLILQISDNKRSKNARFRHKEMWKIKNLPSIMENIFFKWSSSTLLIPCVLVKNVQRIWIPKITFWRKFLRKFLEAIGRKHFFDFLCPKIFFRYSLTKYIVKSTNTLVSIV